MDPFVVTLAIDDEAQARFDEERRRWFPPGRTQVGAHVTLFHALPGAALSRVEAGLLTTCRRPPFTVSVTDVYSLGRGVAYRLASPALMDVHRELRNSWLDLLTPQDTQTFRPHLTVQNKVSGDEAGSTLATLEVGFAPYSFEALGLDLWRYVGGPWQHVTRVSFQGR